MRGGEATCADAGGAQHGGRICADGSFAIGAGDVDRFPGEGAVLNQAADASQAWRDHVIIVVVGRGLEMNAAWLLYRLPSDTFYSL